MRIALEALQLVHLVQGAACNHASLLGYSCDPRYAPGRAIMRDWSAFVRPLITKTPKKVLMNIWKGIPTRRARIILANGGPIRG